MLFSLDKKTILHIIYATFYSNCHFLIARLLNIFFFVKYITENFIFAKKLGCIGLENNNTILPFLNIFSTKITNLLTNIILNKYVYYAYSNSDNYN